MVIFSFILFRCLFHLFLLFLQLALLVFSLAYQEVLVNIYFQLLETEVKNDWQITHYQQSNDYILGMSDVESNLLIRNEICEGKLMEANYLINSFVKEFHLTEEATLFRLNQPKVN